jgi:hypothetical protein
MLQTPEPPVDLFTPFDENGSPIRTEHYLILDGIVYHTTSTSDVPCGFAEVDVKLNDNGTEFDTVLTAGLVGTRVCDSGDITLSVSGKRDTARPVIAWWIFGKKEST